MPNDAKLGMIVGVSVVIVVAAVFFRKEGTPSLPARTVSRPAAVGNAPPPAAPSRPLATKTSHTREGEDGDRHTVAEGDTLFSLAEKYYGDKARFSAIFEANRAALSSPDQLAAGTVLVIPRADAN